AVGLAYALASLHIEWTAGRAAMLIVMIPAGTLIFASVWIATICIVFWIIDGQEVSNVFTYGGQYLTEYPINIYDRWLRRFLAYVVPMAFVAYFPSLYILGKADELGLPFWLQLSSPLVALAAAGVASLVWRRAVRHYPSAGGFIPWKQRTRLARQIGVMFGQRMQLWWDLPLIDSFDLLRHMYRVPADTYARNLAVFREALELDAFIRTPVRQLSLGQRIRG